ncbi:SLIT2 [Branchiostoma lanceolatum]|uniref:SLIT2 protein n=1 Tax=Branchiostoma lanceolatum TaxID=7740 RepID=A0A8J9WEK7_BRALA|nr:SLIT2 [Branchiostoma lanceolatum]
MSRPSSKALQCAEVYVSGEKRFERFIMLVKRMLVLLLIVLKEAGPTAAQTCSSSCSSSRCDCYNSGLTSVPQDLPTTITLLDLGGNDITTVVEKKRLKEFNMGVKRMLVLLLIVLKEAGPAAAQTCSSSCLSDCWCNALGLTTGLYSHGASIYPKTCGNFQSQCDSIHP